MNYSRLSSRALTISVSVILSVIILPSGAFSAECIKTGSVCSEGPSTKNISGVDFYRTCWKYTDTYDCIDTSGSDYYNYCAPLDAAGCTETSLTCTSTAFDGTCVNWSKTYRCGTSIGHPTGTVILDNTYTLVSDTFNHSQCDSIEDNASCVLAENNCVEGPATRIIDGMSVFRTCWKYEKRYACSAGVLANYCAPLQTVGCVESSAPKCLQTATYGTCILYERTYNCNAEVKPIPTNVTYLDSSYTITGDTELSTCTTLDGNPNCTVGGERCIEGPETRVINGLAVYRDCWKREKDYVCASTALTSDCAELQNRPECIESGAPVCVDTLPGGQCGLLEHTYQCAVGSEVTRTVTDCSTQKFCVEGTCFDTSYSPDGDFGLVVAGMEAVREAADYGIFKGEDSRCEKSKLVNCCKTSGGAGSSRNSAIADAVGALPLKVGAEAVRYLGSPYVYEGMFDFGWAVGSRPIMDYAYNSALSSSANPSLSMWGVTVSWGAPVYGAGGALLSPGGFVVGFDPWSLALSVAIMVVTEMMSCDEESQLTAMKRGQGLCHSVGSYCKHKVFGSCWTKEQTYCCFPSKLGLIINEQGRQQIAKGWGSPKHPDCSGFTIAQLQGIDFSKIDFSDFIRTIAIPGKTPEYAIERLNERAASYYTTP